MSAITFTEKIATYLQARPNLWVDGMALAHVGGAYAWRSRLSDARRQYGLTIENRQRREGRRVISEYRFIPSAPAQQADLFQEARAVDHEAIP